jgi:hypothetical protein
MLVSLRKVAYETLKAKCFIISFACNQDLYILVFASLVKKRPVFWAREIIARYSVQGSLPQNFNLS